MPKRIVLIEDEESVRQNIKQILEYEGFEVHLAVDGLHGLQVVREARPDLIISDIMMPNMDGYEVLNAIRRDFATATIPFIFLTAYTQRDSLRKGMEYGADDYIPKPFSHRELVAAVRARLDRQDVQEARLMRAWAHRLLAAQDRDRRRLADVLNDDVLAHLAGLRALLSMNRPDAPARIGTSETIDILDDVMARLDLIASELSPQLLDNLGLLPALLQYVHQFTEATGINVTFEHQGLTQRFQTQAESTIFRVVRESLDNVARHTQVERAVVQVWYEPPSLFALILDRGPGFDMPGVLSGQRASSLLGLSERVRLLGGYFDVYSASGEGTRVSVQLPGDQMPEHPAFAPLYPLTVPPAQSTGNGVPAAGAAPAANAAPAPQRTPQAGPAPASPAPTGSGGELGIVLAVRHELTRHGLVNLLSGQPHISILASVTDADEALNAVQQTAPDVVVTDRELSGPLLGSLGCEKPACHVLVLSQSANEAYVLESLHRGATGFLLMECAAEELLTAISDVAAGKRYISEAISDRVMQYMATIQHGTKPLNTLTRLTPREREVFELVIKGHTSAEIAEMLFISPRTVDTHRANLMHKLDVRNQTDLMRYAAQHGLLPTNLA